MDRRRPWKIIDVIDDGAIKIADADAFTIDPISWNIRIPTINLHTPVG